MVAPALLAGISILGSAVSAGVGAIGAMSQGKAQAEMFSYQAGVANINRQIDLQNADYERQKGEVEAQKSGMETSQRVGEIKAVVGASNLDVKSGSGADLVESQQSVGQHDEATIRNDAARRAYGYEVAATGETAKAQEYLSAASTSRTSGEIGAFSSLLGGATSVANKWYQYGTSFGSGVVS